MEALPSGLSEVIPDSEHLARFLTSSSQYNAKCVKPAAFLPSPQDRTTSVFRHSGQPESQLWQIGIDHAVGARTLYGAAIVTAKQVRLAQLALEADEPPPRHAAIVGWPSVESDPDLEKARHKELAAVITSNACLILRKSSA